MVDELSEFESVLRDLIGQSGQSRYDRKAPNSDSVEGLVALRSDLITHIESEGESGRALEMLASIDETLLRFDSARNWLQMKCDFNGEVTRKDRKRLAILAQETQERKTLPLPPEVEADLLSFLENQDWTRGGMDLSNSLIADWLEDNIRSQAIRESVAGHFEFMNLRSAGEIFRYLVSRRQS